jgi:23S rRNA (uridine2552-2'-O)-methyltransferase
MSKSYQPKDHFFREAKRRGLRARSAFKLDEIIGRFHLVRRGSRVLDLGAAPGGFLQVLAKEVGKEGRVVGVDTVPIQPIREGWVQSLVADVMAPDFDTKLAEVYQGRFDTVISDLAPKTTGIRTTDEARSLGLATRAADIAQRWGAGGSAFLAKLFMGGDFETFRSLLRSRYREVKVVRPEATRARSVEVYLLGLGSK